MNARQERFCQEYLVDLNATQAAIRSGYSKKTAASQAERLLRNVEIQEEVRVGQDERAERVGVTQDDVLKGLQKEAELYGEGSSHSARVAAWSQLGKHLGMFVERHGGPNGEPLQGTQVHVHLADNGRGIAPPVNGNGRSGR